MKPIQTSGKPPSSPARIAHTSWHSDCSSLVLTIASFTRLSSAYRRARVEIRASRASAAASTRLRSVMSANSVANWPGWDWNA